MTRIRILLLSVAIAAALAGLGYMGVRTLSQQIYKARTCNWANIDNIEMHARIDIPKVESCECEYDEFFNVKKSSFTLSDDLNVEEYTLKNQLVPLRDDSPKNVLEYAGNQILNQDKLFARQGFRRDEDQYEVLFDPSTRKLWVYLKYFN